jgi:hypothetical protein
MKTFHQFCEDANIHEFWNPLAKKVKPQSKSKPSTQVLAYKNYKPGVLDKATGQFTQRAHTGVEQKRYGWKPVQASSYSKADTPGSLTASGHRFDDTQRLVAVPYKSKTSTKPSIPFKTKLDLTTKPVGKETKVAKTSVQDTGNFGPAGDYNKSTGMDLSLRTAKDLTPVSTSKEWGKRTIYVRNTQEPISAKVAPKKK